jgi:hypothetical protein
MYYHGATDFSILQNVLTKSEVHQASYPLGAVCTCPSHSGQWTCMKLITQLHLVQSSRVCAAILSLSTSSVPETQLINMITIIILINNHNQNHSHMCCHIMMSNEGQAWLYIFNSQRQLPYIFDCNPHLFYSFRGLKKSDAD